MIEPAIWIPEADDSIKSELPHPLPYEFADNPLICTHLVVVVSNASHLHHARSASDDNISVIIWAWQLPEYLAVQAESSFPVIYQPPTAELIGLLWGSAPVNTKRTSLFWQVEKLIGFPEVFPIYN